MKNANLINTLKEYVSTDIYPMHMPGHKRRFPKELEELIKDVYKVDLTEVYGTDNLSSPNGVLKDVLDKITGIYNTRRSYFLVNGSSVGIISSIHMFINDNLSPNIRGINCRDNSKNIMISDNCHYSVHNAIKILGIEPIIIETLKNEYGIGGGIDLNLLEYKLKKYKPRVLVIVSPTYCGVMPDVLAVSTLCKKYNCYLIVDEAHGAHLNFLPGDLFDDEKKRPISAIYSGADIVIQSIHKTLPAFTQTALLHVINEDINLDYVQSVINIFQTSSPSYIFMGEMDACILYMTSYDSKLKYRQLFVNLDKLNNLELKNIKVYKPSDKDLNDLCLKYYDNTKIIIYLNDDIKMRGTHLMSIFRNEYNIEMEAAYERFCLAITTLCDTEEGFDRLEKALIDIDIRIEKMKLKNEKIYYDDIIDYNKIKKLEKYKGKKYRGCIYIYPPAIPILNNEILSEEVFLKIKKYIGDGFNVLIQDL